jgi:hypothetical protein
MYMTPQEWLDTVRREYLQDFIRRGGAAVKFVVPVEGIEHYVLGDDLRRAAEEEGFLFAFADAASTKIHMIDKLFHEVARQVDWDKLACDFVKQILKENLYELPPDHGEFNIERIALLNDREEKLLRKHVNTWLEKKIYRDFEMSQEFRIAMIKLCMAQLDAQTSSPFLTDALKEWLRGELRLISTLKEALIFQKVGRHNARHMLASLAHWLKVAGKSGLVLCLDVSRYTISARPKERSDTFYYTGPATLDAYEVLRQFVDATDELECCFIVVIAPPEFLSDERRGVNRYDALKLRIYDEVRDRHRPNPLSSLIRLREGPNTLGQTVASEVE